MKTHHTRMKVIATEEIASVVEEDLIIVDVLVIERNTQCVRIFF